MSLYLSVGIFIQTFNSGELFFLVGLWREPTQILDDSSVRRQCYIENDSAQHCIIVQQRTTQTHNLHQVHAQGQSNPDPQKGV